MSRAVTALLVRSAILLCLTPAVVAQLDTRATFPVLYDPYMIAPGDFNHDGAQDVAVTCELAPCAGGIEVLLGKGDGTFASDTIYTIPNSPRFGIAVADLNSDGNLDVVVTEYGGSDVGVLLGNGDGTFQPVISSPAPESGEALRVGDFNNDGILDLSFQVNGFPDSSVNVLFGNGDGTFQTALAITVADYIEDFVTGDFNGDGRLDIVWEGLQSSQVHVLLGNGDGTFRNGPNYNLLGLGPDSLAVGDLNGDGILDLASSGDTFVDVFLGNGDATFGPDLKFSIAFGGEATRIADMNGDGIPDLVFPSGNTDTTTNIAIVLGAGDGTFGPENFFPSGEEGYFFAIADFNGDHQPDVAVADVFGNAVAILLNTNVVAFSPSTTLKFPQQLLGTTSAPQTVQLTNTGATDLRISSIRLTGRGLAMQHTCGQTVAPGGSCKITVQFHPQGVGAVAGKVSIVDSASSRPQVITATAAGTIVSLSPKGLKFGPQKIGTKSAPQDVTVTNNSTQSLNVSSIVVLRTGFLETNTCSSQLGPGASCAVSVTFQPERLGLEVSNVVITDDGGGGRQVIPVQGTGTR